MPKQTAAAPADAICRRWYAVQTLQFCENRARTQLERQGFRAFLPRYAKTVHHARKRMIVHAPLFPRYLFVELDLRRGGWRSVNGTFGVASLVTANDRPIPVPTGVVEALAARVGEDGNLSLSGTLEVGERVQINHGPFADLIGRLARIDGGGRVQVLLRLLGSDVQVSVDRRALMPVASLRPAM